MAEPALGMPLVQALVDLHNGSLKIESVIGEGTSVTVEFPVAAEVATEQVGNVVIIPARILSLL